MRLRKSVGYLAIIAALLVLPHLMTDQYSQHILNMVLIYCILAISVNLVFGYMGALTFGHVAVFAIGAYTSSLLATKLGFSFLPSFFFSGVSGAIVGVVIGIPTLKLAGAYFAMATIGFHKIMEVIFQNWESATGGPTGVTGIPYPIIFGIHFKNEADYYYLIAAIALGVYVLYRNLIRSHRGKTIIAMRDNAIAASAMGIDVPLVRIIVFTISTIFAALAGSLYAHMVRYVAPEAFPLSDSVMLLFMVVLGGPGFLNGPIFGAVVIVLANEYLQQFERFNMLIFGMAIIVLLIVFPSGFAGLIERFKFQLSHKREGNAYVREVGLEEIK
ncbi:MAG: branched-chain amino acid ABC transporter permease [Bradyrhizobiaceae bacterium]|nr:branched-chain amino acid ABC transporter permease [Bradyrhizobiaceae bacterium]